MSRREKFKREDRDEEEIGEAKEGLSRKCHQNSIQHTISVF